MVLTSKIFLFQDIQFRQTLLVQTFHFSKTKGFVSIELNVKIFQFQTIQLGMSNVNNSVNIKNSFNVKNSFILNNSD